MTAYSDSLKAFSVATDKVFPKGVAAQINVMQFDALGNIIEKQDRVNPHCLVVIRVYVERLQSEFAQESIGSLIYANSFILVDENNSITLTESVPNLLQWHTNYSHYANTASLSKLDSDSVECNLLHNRQTTHKDVLGFMPVREQVKAVIERD